MALLASAPADKVGKKGNKLDFSMPFFKVRGTHVAFQIKI